MKTKLTDKGVKLALKLNKLVHNRCKDVFDGKWDIAEIRTDSEDVLIEVLSVFEKFE